MRPPQLAAALALGAALLAPLGAAHAQLNFDFSYLGTGVSASGTFLTNGVLSGGYYTVTGITGQRNGVAISGLVAPGGFFNNNRLFVSSPFVDNSGISYTAGGVAYNVFRSATIVTVGCTGVLEGSSTAPINCGIPQVTLTVSPVSTVPEPGTWALLGTGLLAVGGIAARRKRTTV
jgi:hypothetical protein